MSRRAAGRHSATRARPLIWLSAVLALSACAPPVAIPELELEGVESAVRDSLEKARAAVVEAPDSARAWGRMGMVADAHGLDGVALPCYRRARELDPGNARWPYFIARILAIDGSDLEDTAALLQQVVEIEPRYAPAHLRRAEASLQLAATDDAESSYRRALELDGELVPAHLGLGRIALTRGDAEAAIGHLESARRLDPADAAVRSTLARAYRRAGRLAAAAAIADLPAVATAATAFPDPWLSELDALGVSSSLIFERALARIQNGDFARAVPELEAVARARPRDPYVRAELGGAYQALGRAEDAVRAFGAAVGLKDDWVDARLHLVGLLLDSNRTDEAREHLVRLQSLAPEHPLVGGYVALALTQEGRLAEAVARFARAAESGPLTPRLHGGWGLALAQLGRVVEAETHFREALAGMPESARIHLYLGLALEAQGRLPEALASYRKSMDLEPSPLAAQRLEALR